ncbi:hypothetical protein MLD38_039953 [Melastoma candidum]|uniref:Uncharacterized protein n=1 Tax=Melastoma candidum TaxID=119954 RepID=A0ACB9L3T9_9MYRT|nr:hypothetical protein MLD38_039953 [Melastoma candidum]
MMIATESVIAKKRLKITFSGRRVEAETHPHAYGLEHFRPTLDDRNASICGGNDYDGETRISSGDVPTENKTNIKFSVPIGKKRGSPYELDIPFKKLKFDRSVVQQCSTVLKRLMQHQCGWPFLKPVDPVALNIPDYFSIISRPMDLGTIKSKLENNLYIGVEEFAADVRLTFSNAMLYNPPGNFVHAMADKLNKMFETGWKALETKWNNESARVARDALLDKKIKEINIPGQNEPKTPPLQTVVPKNRTLILAKIKNVTFGELGKVPLQEECTAKSSGDDEKGTNGGIARSSNCEMCGVQSCKCGVANVSNIPAPADLPSERANNAGDACAGPASLARNTSASQTGKGDRDSDGTLSGADEESTYPSSETKTSAMEATSREDWSDPSLDVQLSPKKALRAAMLKSRFADTILKAQQKTLLDHGDKADPTKLQQEKERLEQRQREEKARIEAQIKAAGVAARMRAEVELKERRGREREAARLALQKMEKTVDIGENLETLKELEMLSGCSLSLCLPESDDGSEVLLGVCDSNSGNALERLGLYMKDDYLEDDEEETVVSGEEGELVQ